MLIQRIPSITALRTFVAAARSGNFTRAAEELHVTQGAVSRIVKELEAQVGVSLFVREAKCVVLTTAGKRYQETVADALTRLAHGTVDLKSGKRDNALTVTMLPSVAAKWLAPKLANFVAKYPEIELHTTTSRVVTDLEAEGCDAAIRYGRGLWPDVNAELLADEVFLPVCSPAFAARHRLRRPADLLRCSRLHADELATWNDWFRAAGVNHEESKGPVFNEATALIQAAIESAGIALGRSLLVAHDLAEGRLVAPFQIQVPAQFSYWFVTPRQGTVKPTVEIFRNWLHGQLKRSTATPTGPAAPVAVDKPAQRRPRGRIGHG